MVKLFVQGLNEFLLASDQLPMPENINTDIVIAIAHNTAAVEYTYKVTAIDRDCERVYVAHKSTRLREDRNNER
jgi:hypothetical protein